MVERVATATDVTETCDKSRLCGDPVVSVLMLTYNHQNYLGEALDSILAQNVDFPYEIVIGDDCSTDRTPDIALEYQRRHADKIRFRTSEQNVGVGYNFARTYLACRGKYIFILEGDDFWCDPNKMAIQVKALDQNPDVVITYHESTAYLNGQPVNRHTGARGDLTAWQLKTATPINTLTVAFRRVLDVIPDEVRLSPVVDLFLWSLLGQHGRGLFIPEIKSAYYRMHDAGHFSSQTSLARSRMVSRTFALLVIYYSRANMPDEENFFRKKLFYDMLRSKGATYWIKIVSRDLLTRLLAKWRKHFYCQPSSTK